MNSPGGHWLTALLPFAVIAVVLALRLRSMSRERPLNLATLWIFPLIYVVIAGSVMIGLPPTLLGWALAGLGLAVGVVAGWYRGRMIRIERDPETGKLRQKASPLAIILLVGLIALKMGARALFGESAATHPGSSAMLLTDGFIGFALGLLSATRAELYLRGRRFLSAT